MKILRVFNNNVVLARDDAGGEVILTGRGLGFQARPGRTVDPTLVTRTFIPADGRDPDHLAELLAGIPPEHVQLVGEALAEAGLDATVDDHSLWRGEVERAAGLITALAGAAFLLIAAATAAAIAYATRAGMAAQAAVIETLSLNGASDGTIATLFQRRFGLLAATAGAAGAGLAALMLGALRLVGGEGGLTPALPLAWVDLLVLIACPVLAGLTAVLAARFTALAKLGQRS